MKKIIYAIVVFILPFCMACFEDKGNYDYVEVDEITVEGIPSTLEVLGYVEHIQVTPKITSATEGEITADNPNYTFQYKLGYKGMGSLGENGEAWVDITPESGFNLDVPANYSANSYVCWFTITDKRTNVVTSCTFDIIISSTTSEGWLVLCNEGEEERVRLDMISRLSSTRTEPIYDVAKGMPVLHHATSIGFLPQMSIPGDEISVFSEEGSYMLNPETLESNDLMEFNLNQFALDPGETMIKEVPFPASSYNWQVKYRFAFSKDNVYLEDATSGGSAYGFPLNTLTAGSGAEFKVAPYVGFSWVRPWSAAYGANALFYDIENQRFLGFVGVVGFGSEVPQQLAVIPDPDENRLFSYSTGRDLVYMEGTRRSNGLVYAILEDDAGNRSICGINMGGNGFIQEMYIENVTAPDFSQAKYFAFHSQFPLMFYATDSKVYLYNLGTKTSKELFNVELKASEKVTCMKFNLYRNTDYASLTNQSEEFMNQQYNLIVASYDEAAGTDGGKVAFYAVDGVNDNVSKIEEYTGFAEVVDVVYRERAQ